MEKLTLEQFNALKVGNQNDYKKQEIKDAIDQAKQISAFWPCVPIFSVSEQDGKFYHEYTSLQLVHESLSITIRFDKYKKKYSIFCRSCDDLKNITSYTRQDVQKLFEEPQQIGVLTTKKVQNWVTYWEQVYAELECRNNENSNKEAEFLASIKGLPFRFYDNGKSGEMVKNGLKFAFTISPTYISQKIEVYYGVSANLENFLAMADNKLKASNWEK